MNNMKRDNNDRYVARQDLTCGKFKKALRRQLHIATRIFDVRISIRMPSNIKIVLGRLSIMNWRSPISTIR